jgi:hypothetical protein
MVIFSIERVMAVYFPMSRFKGTHKRKTFLYMFTPLLLALFYYSWQWQMSGLELIGFQMRCVTKIEWFYIAEKLGVFDVVLTIFVPFLIIIVANGLISVRLMKSVIDDKNPEQHDQLVDGVPTSNDNTSMSSRRATQLEVRKSSNPSRQHLNMHIDVICKRRQLYTKTTRTLLLISTVYIFLNAPIALSKVRYFIANLNIEESASVDLSIFNFEFNNVTNHSASSNFIEYTAVDELIERLTCYIYYLNFVVNFLLYRFNGSKIIRRFYKLLKIRGN